ncbi:hypothetical protein BDA99DRAFT_528411 [Phascolomyces articulosus]|uniref:Uncharacterized protein n=1 Tax=Phascolomyces articulosus TaxID=60185 RepID=A0AAD5JMD0_9FUNG|nr:hypothetical protein BDA99DRAFT_528411 [Phascolomyces articulosus]
MKIVQIVKAKRKHNIVILFTMIFIYYPCHRILIHITQIIYNCGVGINDSCACNAMAFAISNLSCIIIMQMKYSIALCCIFNVLVQLQ